MGKSDVFFFLQYKSCGSSSRGIQSGGIVLTLEDLYDKGYVKKHLRGHWSLMYQVGREQLKSVKSMSLQEFESIFGIGNTNKIKYLLDFDKDIPSPFRKEVTQVYGAEAYETKPQMTTRYKSGDIITCADGYDYLYYGKLTNMQISVNGESVGQFSGHLYLYLNNKEYSLESILERLSILAKSPYKYKEFILKTKRKAIADKIIDSGLKLRGHHDYYVEVPRDYFNRHYRKAHIMMDLGE